ncbi:alpha/beta hydrolase [Saccharopolyspora indica]|uniref:alpha/beta hydrolase n=1 Tax=Saccharopolyspora indica TaxID=1229659 RepID=UPI0022EB19B1|nr:alpha/beta hydrolase [Saccharopolyspora indica]MDA3644253.1 alpha/beta hydrolase [Saccharopolyspora indica]
MTTDVRFPSSGMMLAGQLYEPDNPVAERSPAVVVGHPTTGVKEQTAALYAQRLADEGFIALTFDAAYQGESEGEPHGLEDPFQRAEDFRAAVSYLTTRDEVDPERIGVLGICGSGGYVPFAAQTDHRMKAVATVSGADVPAFLRGADPDGFAEMVAQSGRLRSEEAAGEPARTVPVVPDSIDESTPALVREFYDYYKTPRAQHPRATNRYVMRSADQLDQYDSYEHVDKIAPRPLLMIAGTEAATLPFSEGAVAKAGDNAELYKIEGATHVDLYDKDEYVTPAVAKLTEFFTEHLV